LAGDRYPPGDRAGISIIALAGLFWVIGAGSASLYTAATAQQLAQPRAEKAARPASILVASGLNSAGMLR
jgi:hypothetical protein